MRFTSALFSRMGYWSKKYANFPERYINRVTEKIYWRTPRKVQYLPRVMKNRRLYFSVDRPWTNEFQLINFNGKDPEVIPVEPIKNWSFFRGDRVEVLTGPDKGKQGMVKDIIQERNWIIVEGLNTKLHCFGKTKSFPGVYVRQEQPLLVTEQVHLVDPVDLKGTAIEWRYTETGEHVRVSCRTGRIIPVPKSSEETKDYKSPDLYPEEPKDTTAKYVSEVTFEPALKTFEMDIMEKMGIKEDRIPKKYYWY
ncbi:PREDICTED: probable 39S ribosomal protein L24, mitochondrial [Dufourea novaeangliae]|uniref:Large ribosomal subunit protein uL24m n=1 Tax=Dufourea novaeangliae TaxID=178035 RepID=A0A154NXL7_DUFNO|nr:PREDICTED: probable 39S ribosomal protein L24, mitochondrial [Dufourea novaeangliae]KZC04409.1 putative 39S ribosomal protein L24, mitochondrial [Dufourea novaeangliae]